MKTILLTASGSRAYGIHTDASDLDLKGVCFAAPNVYLGFSQTFEQWDAAAEVTAEFERLNQNPEFARVAGDQGVEGSIYELRKFMRLAAGANPNVMDALFCRDADVIFATTEGERLRAEAHLLVSAKAKHTYSGYASSQLKRIRTHRKWLLDPPQAQPTRTEFGLPERTLLPRDQLDALRAAVQKKMDQWELDLDGLEPARRQHIQTSLETTLVEIMATTDDKWLHAARVVGLDDNIIELMAAERRYAVAKANWRQFKGWEKARNPARAELEAKHGYDTKHGAHLYRLLTMGEEILRTGEVRVWRGDRDGELIRSIRAGAWTYDELVEWAESKQRDVDALYRAMYRNGTLEPVVPEKPDVARLDALCAELVRGHLADG